ncbi:cytochrome C [bacterium]|nr:cytochrome C [bacterium]
MNYPVWDLFATGGGFWIALVATVHVFVSHFAVGGGLWLVLTERKALREGDADLLGYVKGHAKFFLLLTMVFGGLTGVGIWWTIALLSPAGTSVLIHNFVFGWATEWVCFVGEIVALFIYHYTFGRMRAREHQIIGWFYFVFAWLSLVLITGIIGFMLTPGAWTATGDFWDGFLNPTFLPGVVFRTFLSLMIAGMFGLVTAVHRRQAAFREKVIRWSAGWILAPFALMLASAWWYVQALPDAQAAMILHKAHEIAPFLQAFAVLTPVLLVGALVMVIRLPGGVKKPLAYLVMLIGFFHMTSFEFIREAGRRPYVIHGHMYSNSVLAADVDRIDAEGVLKVAKWTEFAAITPENELGAGEEIFRLECTSCHSRGGVLNDILPLTAGMPLLGVDAQLSGQGTVVEYMPPFVGTAQERHAVARYITEGLHGMRETAPVFEDKPLATDIPPFDVDQDAYVLLAWNNLGMHCLSDSDPYFVILPPANEIQAQLIRRGETPEVVTEGVKITYKPEAGFEDPAANVRFWEFDEQNFGVDLARNVGLKGFGMSGELHLEEARGIWEAPMVPIAPYDGEGHYNPFPLFTIEAVDAESGDVLAMTKTVVPTATEMGCQNCHGGGWRVDGVAGFTDATSAAILAVHDKHSGTELLKMAERGEPRLCASCHEDPATGTGRYSGNEDFAHADLLNLPAAVHGWHANYLRGAGAEACAYCHPANPQGATQCLRGGHSVNLDCTNCHGRIEDHALGLLKAEQEKGKPGAARLMANLVSPAVASHDEVVGRVPWLQEPDCLACHEDFTRPDPATASAVYKWVEGPSGLYRFSSDESGLIPCLSCHGSPHATFPTHSHKYGADRDNILPLQVQGNRRPIGAGGNCKVCHTIDMEDSIHHENMENP